MIIDVGKKTQSLKNKCIFKTWIILMNAPPLLGSSYLPILFLLLRRSCVTMVLFCLLDLQVYWISVYLLFFLLLQRLMSPLSRDF